MLTRSFPSSPDIGWVMGKLDEKEGSASLLGIILSHRLSLFRGRTEANTFRGSIREVQSEG